MAQEFTPGRHRAGFRGNGTLDPRDADYHALRDAGFAGWRLEVDGLVEQPLSFSLAELRALPSRTQITRHDCVEGWSCIGKWTGVPLGRSARPGPAEAERDSSSSTAPTRWTARADGRDSRYYESIDLDDAYHPQTILAYDLNDQPLPVPQRRAAALRVERQLGYKQAKYLMRIELVESFDAIGGGKGGYWEDHGYEWYGGI